MSRYPAAAQLGNYSKERLERESIIGGIHLWVWRYATRVGRPDNIRNKYAKTRSLAIGEEGGPAYLAQFDERYVDRRPRQ